MASGLPENSISSAIADKLISVPAARDLCRTMSEISAAAEKLQRMGLMPDGAEPANAAPPAQSTAARAEKLPPPDEIPQYRSEDIVRRSKENGEFAVWIQRSVHKFTGLWSSCWRSRRIRDVLR